MKIAVLFVVFSLAFFGGARADYTGIVAEIEKSSSGCIKVNMDGHSPHQKMVLYVAPTDAAAVGALPPVGAKVTATGPVTEWEGHQEIVIHSKDQWRWEKK